MEAVEEQLSLEEAVHLGAVDSTFYSSFYFPRAYRQASPPFHKEIWNAVEDPNNRYVGIKVFRGGAKTTLLRTFTSKRIAYGLSRTILFVSEAQDHSIKSLEWLKNAVLYNRLWADSFGLKQGKKWAEHDCEIEHTGNGNTIRLIALGITGQTRGVNVEDFRPDLIVVDDPCDEENTATEQQRLKISNLFFGALGKSLAPRSECEDAKMVLLQTPLHREDLIESCMKDPQWKTLEYSCFTEDMRSRWEVRFPTKELLEEKAAHIARRQLALWTREMEVKVISSELSLFGEDWLQYYDILPTGAVYYVGVDPTPPPKDSTADVNQKLDDAAIVCIAVYAGKVYLVEYYVTKSPHPDEFINKIFEFAMKYRPQYVNFESILFARTTKFYLEQEMHKRRYYFQVNAVEDRRKKSVRIAQAVTSRAANKTIYVKADQLEFISQYTDYPAVPHDDLLDAFSMAITAINPLLNYGEDGELLAVKAPELPSWRAAP